MNANGFMHVGKRIEIAALGLAIVILGGCKAQEVTCHRVAEPIIVDGGMTDWAAIPTTFFEKQAAAIGVASDGDRLYLLFRFRDPQWARAIRTSGLTLWVNADGKKNRNFGIKFNGGPDLKELTMERDEPGASGRMPEMFQKRPAASDSNPAVELRVINTDWWYESQAVSLDGLSGPAAGFAHDEGFFSYEFSLPLVAGSTDFFGLGAVSGQSIAIGAEWGGIDQERVHGMMGGRFGGPGGSPPGGMDGGRPGGGRGGISRPEKQEIWFKTTLVAPEEKTPGEK